MALFNIEQSIDDTLPPDKRTPKMRAWVKALLSGLKWIVDLVQTDYFSGTSYLPYSNATNYAKGDRVTFGNSVYESKVNGNIGNAITDTTYWVKRLNNTIGLDERKNYNSQKLMLEYALNRRFGGVFQQPPAVSEIYITKVAPASRSFAIYNGLQSSAIFSTTSDGAIFNEPQTVENVDMIIHIPDALFTTEEEIRQFVDRYNIYGTDYIIETY